VSVLVIMEQAAEGWRAESWEALAAGHRIASELALPLEAAVLGPKTVDELAAKALSRIHHVNHPLLASYSADAWTAASEALIHSTSARVVVVPHTYRSRDFAPRLATRFEQVLVSDVVAIRFENSRLIPSRPVFQGKLHADINLGGLEPRFLSIQAGAFDGSDVPAGQAEVTRFDLDLGASAVRVLPGEPFRESASTMDLSRAERIVAVGRGIGDQDNLRMVEELARALGAELAASRPVCDNGWLPLERQVGSSGQTVAPKLYLALGISGATQHVVGMRGSQTVVAINKDPDAPIFEIADYAIVGDVTTIVPALIEALNPAG